MASTNEMLLAAWVAALNALGWQAARWDPHGVSATERHGAARVVGLVLVADEHDRMPDHAVLRSWYDGLTVVAIGTASSVRLAVAHDAVAALNPDQPLIELIETVDQALLSRSRLPRPVPLSAALREREREARRFTTLTPREQDVLGALITGQSPTEIAVANWVKIATVRSQITAILTKLGVSSQLSAVALAHRSCQEARIVTQIRRHRQY